MREREQKLAQKSETIKNRRQRGPLKPSFALSGAVRTARTSLSWDFQPTQLTRPTGSPQSPSPGRGPSLLARARRSQIGRLTHDSHCTAVLLILFQLRETRFKRRLMRLAPAQLRPQFRDLTLLFFDRVQHGPQNGIVVDQQIAF